MEIKKRSTVNVQHVKSKTTEYRHRSNSSSSRAITDGRTDRQMGATKRIIFPALRSISSGAQIQVDLTFVLQFNSYLVLNGPSDSVSVLDKPPVVC